MTKKVIPVSEPNIGKEELKNITQAVKSGWLSHGNFVDQFENDFARFCQTNYAVSVMNGTAALHLALLTLGVGAGDEVIVPALTFVATANAVSFTGAKAVLVDVDFDTWNINSQHVKAKISSRTKAIIPVHLYGHPADMDPILRLAQKHNLCVVEDAAEAHGALYKNKPVGGLGDIGIFSFYGNKTITTGEGGMLVTNNKKIADRARFLKAHGMSPNRRYYHPEIGFNYRMTNLQAAVGVAQLAQIRKFIQLKRRNAMLYNKYLRQVPGITLPPEKSWARNIYWMYSVLIDDNIYSISRDKLMSKLQNLGIETRPFFVPLHRMPMYRASGFPVADKLSQQGINLPSSTKLTPAEIQKIAIAIKPKD